MPMSKSDLKALFDYLETQDSACDNTLKGTSEFLAAHSLDREKIVPWLQEHGGYCDCEVLANVESTFEVLLRTDDKAKQIHPSTQ